MEFCCVFNALPWKLTLLFPSSPPYLPFPFSSALLCLQAATGEEIGAEELGGADVHCGISGCTDHYAASEEEGMAITRSIVASLNQKRRNHSGRIEPGEQTSGSMGGGGLQEGLSHPTFITGEAEPPHFIT